MFNQRPLVGFNGGSPLDETGCTATLAKTSNKPARLSLVLDATMIVDMGFDANGSYRLEIGTNDKHGTIRLISSNSGDVKFRFRELKNRKFIRISLGVFREYVNRQEKVKSCVIRKFDDTTIEIILPKWAQETAPRKPSAERQAIEMAKRALPSTLLKSA